MILTISTAFGLLATDTLIHINAPPIPSKSSWYTNRCRDDLYHKGNHHILTSVFGVQRLSSSIYLHPDSSPFYCFSKNDSSGSRLACLGNRLKNQTSNLSDLPMNFGHKKRASIHLQCGANRRSMYEVIFNFICYNGAILKTSAFCN